MDQPVNVHEPHHEARRATASVLVYSFQVLIQANRRRPNAVESSQALPTAALAELVIPRYQLLEHEGEDGQDSRRGRRRGIVAAGLRRRPGLVGLRFAAA